jgi:transcription elongation GreA/GreB family factor
MSKAFTREEDDAGFTLEVSRRRDGRVAGPVTALGARLARERPGFEAVARAPLCPPPQDTGAAALGAQVRVRSRAGAERGVFIASVDEIGLVPHAASATSPLARALMGSRAGDVVEVDGPRGVEELTVVDVRYPA